MCTLEHDPSIEIPEKGTLRVYKVFGRGAKDGTPKPFVDNGSFKTGMNEWDPEICNQYNRGAQKGFQVFADEYGATLFMWEKVDVVIALDIDARDIVKAEDLGDFGIAYEVTKFELPKEVWDNRKDFYGKEVVVV